MAFWDADVYLAFALVGAAVAVLLVLLTLADMSDRTDDVEDDLFVVEDVLDEHLRWHDDQTTEGDP